MDKKLYFAYGSNIDLTQMDYRCPEAEVVGPVTLRDYALLFRGRGFSTIEPEPGSIVHGLLWRVSDSDERRMDLYESYPRFYDKETVTVQTRDGQEYNVMAYVMVGEMAKVREVPSRSYYRGILNGYQQNGLPVEALEQALNRSLQEQKRQRVERFSLWDVMTEEPDDPETRLYFAYGSNINLEQMARRCPDAEPVGHAVLRDHALLFRGRTPNAETGVATIAPLRGGVVHGLLWEITPACERALNRYEGASHLYQQNTVEVLDTNGDAHSVLTYVMTDTRARTPVLPSFVYYETIREGYIQNSLPLKALGRAIKRTREEMAQGKGILPPQNRRRNSHER